MDTFLINITKETPAGTVHSGNYFDLQGIASMNLSFEIKINGSQENDFCLDHCINEDSCSIVEGLDLGKKRSVIVTGQVIC